MRVELLNGLPRVVLSKRNLLALLSKLEMPGSACTIVKDGVYVSSEPDEEHYQGRTPGEMHPLTEVAISKQ